LQLETRAECGIPSFDTVDAPFHALVRSLGRIWDSTKGSLDDGRLVFEHGLGALKKLKENKSHVKELIDAAVERVLTEDEAEDLPMNDAAIKAS
jgi:hypothetical protein